MKRINFEGGLSLWATTCIWIMSFKMTAVTYIPPDTFSILWATTFIQHISQTKLWATMFIQHTSSNWNTRVFFLRKQDLRQVSLSKKSWVKTSRVHHWREWNSIYSTRCKRVKIKDFFYAGLCQCLLPPWFCAKTTTSTAAVRCTTNRDLNNS